MTESGGFHGDIWRSDLDGRNLMNIAEGVGVVSGMAIDHERCMLYWIDTSLQVIERTKLDGSGREVFLRQQFQQPVTISIYGDSFYWVMGSSGILQKCSVIGQGPCMPVLMKNHLGQGLFAIPRGSKEPIDDGTAAPVTDRFWRTVDGITTLALADDESTDNPNDAALTAGPLDEQP
ncbi:vitellogenin receptor-like [Diachasmimorpha longicaudata]